MRNKTLAPEQTHNPMANRSKIRMLVGLAVLICVGTLSFAPRSPFREMVFEAVHYYRNLLTEEEEGRIVADGIPEPSPGEAAHNENYFGVGRLENKDYKGAIEKFISATTLDPAHPEYHANLAVAYEKDGQHDRAIDQLSIALAFEPDDPNLLSWLGTSYFSKEQWGKAAEAYDRSIDNGADDHLTLFNASQAYLEAGQLTKAISAIESAIALKGNDADYYRVSGMIKYYFRQYEDSLRDFEAARNANPDSAAVGEWIEHITLGLRDGNMPRIDHDADGKPVVDSRASDPRQKKLDEIFERMERIKEDFWKKYK